MVTIGIILGGCETTETTDITETEEIQSEEETSGEPLAQEDVEVAMANMAFNPETITINSGTTIVWINNDNIAHTIVSGIRDSENAGEMFESSNVRPGETFGFTFEESGSYSYFCSIHPGMEGQVIVEE